MILDSKTVPPVATCCVLVLSTVASSDVPCAKRCCLSCIMGEVFEIAVSIAVPPVVTCSAAFACSATVFVFHVVGEVVTAESSCSCSGPEAGGESVENDGTSLPARTVALGAEAETGPVPRGNCNSGIYFVRGWSLAAALLLRSLRTTLVSFKNSRVAVAAARPRSASRQRIYSQIQQWRAWSSGGCRRRPCVSWH